MVDCQVVDESRTEDQIRDLEKWRSYVTFKRAPDKDRQKTLSGREWPEMRGRQGVCKALEGFPG